ncbi:MAG: hypothetical protein ACLPKI_11445 [Streptosporangiaceae bacterium]
MTVYRLMDGMAGRPDQGPGLTRYSGNFLAGLAFQVTSNGCWFEGFWWWVPANGDTGPQNFALWQITNTGLGTLVPSGIVESGTLTAGQWNYVPLPSPIALTATVAYMAATGWQAKQGFPDTNSQFGSGQPYGAGITSGPLQAYSDSSGSNPVPHHWSAQGCFGVASANPTVTMPNQGSGSANFWIDAQVTDTAPDGSSYRLWPGLPVPQNTIEDSALNFTLATEFNLSAACTLDNIWFYSPPGATQRPTASGIWQVSSKTLVAGTENTAPNWSAGAGSGWVSCSYSGVTLAAGDYKVAVCNSAASPQMWNLATIDYWSTGAGGQGITTGPLSAPNLAQATSPGQSTYQQGSSFAWPGTYDTGGAPCYWVDVEVTPSAGGTTGGGQGANPGQFLAFW